MLSVQEVNALAEILSRVPMSQAEQIFIRVFLRKLSMLCQPTPEQQPQQAPIAPASPP